MPDIIVAKGSDAKFSPHDEGQFVGQCVDAIDLGERVEEFQGGDVKVLSKCVLVFRTGEKNAETGGYIDIAREFTVSMSEKANLRKFLEQWRGKPYTSDDVQKGIPLHKLAGNYGLLTIAHRKSAKGRTYANVTACVGVPKQMAQDLTPYPDYQRAEYWADRKQEYADGVRKFRGQQQHGLNHDDYEGDPGPAFNDPDTDSFNDGPDSSLPF